MDEMIKRAVIDGIHEAFREQEDELTEREKDIIEATVEATIRTINAYNAFQKDLSE